MRAPRGTESAYVPGGGAAPAPSAHTCRVCSARIMRLQDELVTLRLECTNLYRKGHFSTLELAPASTLSTTQVKGEPLTKGLHTSSASWFRKPMTRTELVAISSSEDEGSLRFVYELLAWVEEMQVRAASASLDQTADGLVVLFSCLYLQIVIVSMVRTFWRAPMLLS